MQELAGKTAVITGAASGIGRACANRFAAAGMNVVLSDIEAPRLDEAVAEVAAHGTSVVGQITDVADGDSVDELADRAFAEFGGVHVLCNNAGVAESPSPDFISMGAWEWVMNVNFWGVVHGHRAFLPRMIEQGEGHVVNTASMAGHLPGHSPYTASKWAVVGITQGLYNTMAAGRTGIGVSCLCPGWVRTDIAAAARNQPESAAPPALYEPTEQQIASRAFLQAALEGGAEPDAVADLVHDAVTGERFWIFTDLDMVQVLRDKHDSILENRNPTVFGLLELD
jgi:NAD(P)-dependent dehydrogenase (short-subunit alcohol dehydrogenase family)